MKKLLVLLLTLCFSVALLAGCSTDTTVDESTEAPATDATEAPEVTEAPTEAPVVLDPVNLIWYVIGDKGPDHDEIFGVLNEKTLADPKVAASVECKFLAWADWKTQYGLILASGETFDMIFAAKWAYYGQQASKGAYLELTQDLLSTYAPNCAANIPEEAWKQTLVNGKMYMIPNTQDEYSTQAALALRGDFMKEFGMTDITTIDQWQAYLDKVKELHPEIVPYDEGNSWTVPLSIFYTQLNGLYAAETLPFGFQDLSKEDGGGVLTMPGRDDRDRYLAALATTHEWMEKGYWSKTALSNTVRTQDLFIAGKSATAESNIATMNQVYQQVMPDNPDWDPYLVNLITECPYAVRTSFLGNGFAINVNAANPERALMWIDAVKYTQEYTDLAMLGIEGKHWILNADGTKSSGPDAANITSWSWWGINCWETQRQASDNSPQFTGIMAYYGGKLTKNKTIYMSYSTEGVDNEIAALTVLYNEYEPNFNMGLYPDYETKLDAYTQGLLDAGWQKCADSYATQMAAYMEAMK